MRGWHDPSEQCSRTGPAQLPVACQLGQSASTLQALVQIERGLGGGPNVAVASTGRHVSGNVHTLAFSVQSRPKLAG